METGTIESIPIALGREDDGRWWAGIESMPAYLVRNNRAIYEAGRFQRG